VAIDFETADNGRDSACSIAAVRIKDSKIDDVYKSLIKPPRRSFRFTHIHGISWEDVRYKPTFAQLEGGLKDFQEPAEWCYRSNANLSPKGEETPVSCYKLTPLSQRDRAVLLEVVATCELTVEVEVVVDRSMDGGERLQGLHVPDFRHRPFPKPSSGRTAVKVFGVG
jgi:hypothetical protein